MKASPNRRDRLRTSGDKKLLDLRFWIFDKGCAADKRPISNQIQSPNLESRIDEDGNHRADGATFDIIKPLASAGRLPVLSRLMREGVSAPLRSTILPNSFPGWASCTTGTSEACGVFSPFIKNPSNYTVRAMSGRDIMTRPVWDILTEHGGRSIVLNVPTTYPPEPINGLMVTGMLTPGRGSEFTHPSALKNELLAEFPNYVIEPIEF
jgi:predicted AlkP superfamily phosphohydrolase/phosphomutase